MSHWKLASPDHSTLTLDLDANDETGAMNGTLTHKGKSYGVAGGWDASGSVPGRNYSAFGLSGRTPGPPDVPSWIAAAGIMTGPGGKPTQIDIRVSVSSSSDGKRDKYEGVLLPWDGAVVIPAVVIPPQGYIEVDNTFSDNPAEGFQNVDFHLKLHEVDELAGTFWSNTFTFHHSTSQLPPNHVGGDQGGYLGVQVRNPGDHIAIFSIFWATGNTPGEGAQVTEAVEMWYSDANPWEPPITDSAHTDPNRKVAGGPYVSIRLPITLLPDVKYRLRISAAPLPFTGWSAYVMNEVTQVEEYIGTLDVPPSWGGIGRDPGGFMERFKDMPDGCASIPSSTTTFYPATANEGAISSTLSTKVYGTCKDEVTARYTATPSTDGSVTVRIAKRTHL